MLDFLRRGVRSWVAKALLALLVVSFAVWGIGDVASGLSTRVATVGDTAVEADQYGRALRRATQEYGIDPSRIRESGLDRFVLARLVRQAAFDEAASALGVEAPDSAVAQAVRSQPSFQTGGEFDATRYAEAVRRVYGSVADFEETVRAELTAALVTGAATVGAAPPPGAAEALARREAERRRFEAVVIGADAVAAALPEPTEAELQAHLEAHPDRFERAERRDVVWLEADVEALAASAPVAEEALRALYEDRRDRYVEEETREVDQIVLDDRAEAEAAVEQARAEGFDAMLEARGVDPADAALGRVTRSQMFGASGEAAFAAAEPGVVGPVETPGGFAVLDVRAIEPGETTPFEEVRDELVLELGASEARAEAERLYERVADLRAAGATLEEIADEFGLTLRRAEGLTRDGPAEGLAGEPMFLEEAFAAEPGEERDILRTADGGWFALRVDAVEPARPATLEEARDAVAADWAAERRRAALAEAAETARARLEAGEATGAVAEAAGGEAAEIGPLSRNDPDPRLGPEARETLFAGEVGDVAATVGAERAVVARLAGVEPGENLDRLTEAFRQALAQGVAADQAEYLGRALEAAAGVSLNPTTVDSVVAQVGG